MLWKEKRQELLAHDYMIQTTMSLMNLFVIGRKAYPSMVTRLSQKSF